MEDLQKPSSTVTGFPWFEPVRMNTRCETWKQEWFALVRTHSMQTGWCVISSDSHYGNAWFALIYTV